MDYRWLKDQHLKLKVSLGQQIIDAIAFNAADRFEFNPMLGYVDLVYTLERNVLMVSPACNFRLYVKPIKIHP